MKNGRIILKATLSNVTPVGIGSGNDAHSDRDVVTTLYPVDDNCVILAPEKIGEAQSFKRLPFIPATSFMGKINTLLVKGDEKFKTLWGKVDEEQDDQKVIGNASFIDCSDILITKLPSHNPGGKKHPTEIREGIRLDSVKGTVAPGAKFDYELLAPGAKFSLTMIFRIESVKKFDENKKKEVEDVLTDYRTTLDIASTITHIINNGFDLGAKSAVGFGRMTGKASLFELDFENREEFQKWIDNEPEHRPIKSDRPKYLMPSEDLFEIQAAFQIKNSLIIRSYSKDPRMPDSTHLKSGGKNILSGTSIKGALRGRAERILNTIQEKDTVTKTILTGLFGDVEKDGVTVKTNGYTVPSRIFVDEIPIEDVKEEIQTRIQIDRFTGGTIDGALIEEVPVFPLKDENATQLKNFRIRVNNAQPIDKGILLLLLKDLWTSDLPIGGEKAIGRGTLIGKKAMITDGTEQYILPEDFKKDDKIERLHHYVDVLNPKDELDLGFYCERVNKFKNKRK